MYDNPAIVTSPVSVDIAELNRASEPSGGPTTRKNIKGFVVMPYGTYKAERDRLESMINEAEKAVTNAVKNRVVLEEFANECYKSDVCNRIATAKVEARLND